MDRTTNGGEAHSGSVLAGWNFGALLVRSVRLPGDRAIEANLRRPRGDEFDGYVKVGAFNRGHATSASGAIPARSLRTGTPGALIESDGDSITTGQLRQLETLPSNAAGGEIERRSA